MKIHLGINWDQSIQKKLPKGKKWKQEVVDTSGVAINVYSYPQEKTILHIKRINNTAIEFTKQSVYARKVIDISYPQIQESWSNIGFTKNNTENGNICW